MAGLISLLPLYITSRILLFLFEMVDGPLGNKINNAISYYTGIAVHIPGLGLIGTVGVVLCIGWLTRVVLFREGMRWLEELIAQIPLVRSLYSASRQIVVPFTDGAKLPFSQVVLVEYPMLGRYTLGLLAKDRVSDNPDDPRVVVFFPSNHLHLGYPVILDRKDVQPIDMPVEEAVKFFVSCGIVSTDKLLLSNNELIPWNMKLRGMPHHPFHHPGQLPS
jgi:uncharacterized membrane protein